MKSLQDYTVVIRPDDNGTFVAYVPAIPSCHAWGRTSEEARAELVYVFEMIQEEYALDISRKDVKTFQWNVSTRVSGNA